MLTTQKKYKLEDGIYKEDENGFIIGFEFTENGMPSRVIYTGYVDEMPIQILQQYKYGKWVTKTDKEKKLELIDNIKKTIFQHQEKNGFELVFDSIDEDLLELEDLINEE